MKKLIIAATIATVAAAAHADVTLGGKMQYDLTKGATSTSGISASEIVVTSKEDLGGGKSITARMGIDGAGRNETLSGTNATLTLATKAGDVMVGQIKLANGIVGNGLGGAPVMSADADDGIVLGGAVNKDIIKYTTPSIGGFKAAVGSTRSVDATGARGLSYSLTGKVAGLNTLVDYNDTSKRVRASASAKVGPLTVGAGVSRNETGKADSSVFGASIPVGANLTVGAARSSGNGTANELGVRYAFSKSTAVQVAYRDVTGNSTAAKNVSTTQVRLSHAF